MCDFVIGFIVLRSDENKFSAGLSADLRKTIRKHDRLPDGDRMSDIRFQRNVPAHANNLIDRGKLNISCFIWSVSRQRGASREIKKKYPVNHSIASSDPES